MIDDAVEEVDRKPRPQLVVGPGGEAHVVHIGSREEDPPRLRPLLHAHPRDGGDWQAAVIDRVSSGEIGFEPALAIDEAGALTVTYHAHGTFDRDRGFVELRHATRRANGSWQAESWRWPAHVGGEVPVAVDASGHVHLLTVAVGGEVDRIEHAMGEEGSWLRSTVSEGVVRTPRMALGPDGAVHAIYIRDRDLEHARRAPCARPDANES